jgi:hypothetical protein
MSVEDTCYNANLMLTLLQYTGATSSTSTTVGPDGTATVVIYVRQEVSNTWDMPLILYQAPSSSSGSSTFSTYYTTITSGGSQFTTTLTTTTSGQ